MDEEISIYLKTLLSTIDNLNIEEIKTCVDVLLQAYKDERQIFVCGNGGSAATSAHLACDLNKGVSLYTNKRFKIISLVSEMSTLTAYSNDESYGLIFVEQLKNFFQKGDIVIGISGSGNSKNVLNVIEYANNNGGTTIGWTGFDGGILKNISSYSINTNVDDMQISEDLHMTFVHLMMRILSLEIINFENSL